MDSQTTHKWYINNVVFLYLFINILQENDDVLGCRVNSGTVTVVDTWNPSTRRAANVLDATQDGLCVQSTSFTNGRITCRYAIPTTAIMLKHTLSLYRFSRTIAVTDMGQDFNLNSSYYLLFGRRAAGTACMFNSLCIYTVNT